jgi:hypothetical protein
MITWFLIVCTHVSGGSQCLPAQQMKSEKACVFMGNAYRRTGTYVSTRCAGIKE